MSAARPSGALRPSILRAAAAVLALGMAAWGQFVLERARLALQPAPAEGFVWLLAAAFTAVAATWRGRDLCDALRPLSVVAPGWRWIAACLPGLGLLLAAALSEGRGMPGRVLALWLAGVAYLLAIGAAQAWGRRGPRTDPWSRRQVALGYALVVGVALAMRLAYDLQHLPAFVENDEAFTGMHGRVIGRQPYEWFGIWEVGIPNMVLVFVHAAHLVFGENLWGSRMGGVVMGTVSVAATFAFARRLIGNGPGLLAALLVATAHAHVHWSRNGHMYIQTPAAAAVILALLARVWMGGTLLAWVGAAVALGVGTQTYQASFALPLIVLVTAIGWAGIGKVDWKAAVLSTVLIELVAVLMLAPVGRALLRESERSMGREKHLFILNPETLRALANDYQKTERSEILLEHVRRTTKIFNSSVDNFPNYGANRSLVDAVTAAMVPVAAAMLLVRLWSPVGWVCLVWAGAYLTLGVLLCAHPPTYHRVTTVTLFVGVGVVWALRRLAATIQAGFRLPHRTVAVLTGLFVVAAGAANAHYYFQEFRLQRGMQHAAYLTWLICRYGATHTVIDATALDGGEYIPVHNMFPDLECPNAKRVRCWKSADLWEIGKLTNDDHVVLIVPEIVRQAHPGEPAGYRVLRHEVDDSIEFPQRMPLAVYELERVREPSAGS